MISPGKFLIKVHAKEFSRVTEWNLEILKKQGFNAGNGTPMYFRRGTDTLGNDERSLWALAGLDDLNIICGDAIFKLRPIYPCTKQEIRKLNVEPASVGYNNFCSPDA